MAKDRDNNADNTDLDNQELTKLSADQSELEGIMSKLMGLQQELMTSMGDGSDPEAMEKALQRIQSNDTQKMYGKLMDMQRRYAAHIPGGMGGDLALPAPTTAANNDDVKHHLGAIRGKIRKLVDDMQGILDRIETTERRIGLLEHKINILEKKVK